MRTIIWGLLAVTLITFAGCDSTETVRGGATDNAGYGRVKIGAPF